MKVVRTRRGARLVDGREVVSEILARPGASGTLFDVLAACVAALAPGPRVAILGFAGGGVVAPLRAMGFAAPLTAVDLSRASEPLFRRLSRGWAGDVRLTRMEASAWLRRQKAPFDLILEDLFLQEAGGAVKPRVSLDVLPQLMRDRLSPRGIVVTNVLPAPGMGWEALLDRLAAPHPAALVLRFRDYENRLVIAGGGLESAARVSRRIRVALDTIDSSQAAHISVRALPGS